MTDLLKIAEKAIPMLDELALDVDVIYKVEMTVKRNRDGSYMIYMIRNVNMTDLLMADLLP